MKQQLPLLDLTTQKNNVNDNQKEVSQVDQIQISNNNSEVKNLNFARNKIIKRSVKPSNEIKETPEINFNNLKSSRASNNDNNEYKELKPSNEERNNFIGSPSKSLAFIVSDNQLALKKFGEFEELKKKMEDIKIKKQESEEQIRLKKIRGKLEKIVDSNFFVIFFMILTVFIMFITDIQNGWLPASSDNAIDYLQTIILLLFTLEIVVTCFAKEGYVNSFFFWLDVVSTISIIQDIGFMFDPLLSIGSTTTTEYI